MVMASWDCSDAVRQRGRLLRRAGHRRQQQRKMGIEMVSFSIRL